MPLTITVGQACLATLHEFTGPDGTGNEVPPIGPVVYSSSDETIATVDANSGMVTAVAPGAATITGTDQGNGLTAGDIVSDTPLAATSAVLVLSPLEVNPLGKKK